MICLLCVLNTSQNITFACANHLKDHLSSSTIMQASLLVKCSLLFHFFLLCLGTKVRTNYRLTNTN